MNRIIILLAVFLFGYGACTAQSAILQNEIDLIKKEAVNQGFTLLDYGGGETNYDWVLTFDPTTYYSGYIYQVVAYLEGCSYCDVGMYFQKSSTGSVQQINPKIERAGGVVRAVYSVNQTITAYGNLSVYAKSREKVYTYSLLFRKPVY